MFCGNRITASGPVNKPWRSLVKQTSANREIKIVIRLYSPWYVPYSLNHINGENIR